MERSVLETVDLLGLDVMLASIAILLTLATVGDLVRHHHRETAAPRTTGAGAEAAPSRPELVVTDWFGPPRPAARPAQTQPSRDAGPTTRMTPVKPREPEVA